MTTRHAPQLLQFLLAVAVANVFVPAVAAQEAAADLRLAALEARLGSLDDRSTDWVLLRDVCDKAAAIGAAAAPVLDKAIAAVADRKDQRFAVRLLGAQARVDERGVQRLRAQIVGQHAGVAAFAARVLGRCGATGDLVQRALLETFDVEHRPGVAAAVALGAADAGVTALAPAIEHALSDLDLEEQVAAWLAVALGRLSAEVPVATVEKWLRGSVPLADAGAVAARWHPEASFEQLLLVRMRKSEGDVFAHVVGSLGSCGGDAAMRALQLGLDADRRAREDEQEETGTVMMSSETDPRLLALARLGDPAAQQALAALIGAPARGEQNGVTFEMLTPQQARLAELYGKYRCADAAKHLLAVLADEGLSCTARGYAARGLCWQRDRRGLEAAAALLVTPHMTPLEQGLGMALVGPQNTLHEFVANADRPDYVVIGDDEQAAAEVGRAWQEWLAQHADSLEWREPLPADDLLTWR